MIVGFTGFSQVGKDTAASFLVELGFTRIAFADILRQSLYNLNPLVKRKWWTRRIPVQTLVDQVGWDVAKVAYREIRELLQRFGTEVGRELYGDDFWVGRALANFEYYANCVITDVRFQNEEAAVHSRGGRVFRIERPGTGAVNAHVSDTGISSLDVDGVIQNNGDLDQFRTAVLTAVGLS